MAYASVKIREIIERAVQHSWSIPEFQRGFVWKATQVRDLAESLWLDYPVGTLLIWNSSGPVETRGAADGQVPSQWVVDGQQRSTALCILSGRKPYWWAADWDDTLRKYDVRFDVHTKSPPYFLISNAATRKVKGHRYIPVRDLLMLDTNVEVDQKKLQELAKQVKLDGFCDGMDAMEVYTRLDRVRKIREKEVVTITVDNELEDVVEIFARLNSKGTRVREADIYLGVVAAHNQGWVHKTFLPFLSNELAPAGFDVDPNLLFRTVTAVGSKHVRFKQIPKVFWQPTSIEPAWARTLKSWKDLVARLREYGISTNDILPTDAALVTAISLVEKFPSDPFPGVLYWFLQASRLGRYSASGTTSLEEDLRDIEDSSTQKAALEKLLRRLAIITPVDADLFKRDYADTRFGRFLLYLLVYRNHALDWDERGHRLGFDNAQLLAEFRPQWHHIFPKKFLEGKISDEKINALANIAVIGPAINIRISKRDPLDYIPRYKITSEKLQQQFVVGNPLQMTIENFSSWLTDRAERLAKAANEFLESLRGELQLPALPDPAVAGAADAA